jgi:hypothetical protein
VGDQNRNNEFCKFIKKTYPKLKSILVVADCKAELSNLLGIAGYTITTVEPKPRKKTMQNLGRGRIKLIKAYFDENFPVTQDLIVGMHPDEATMEIILAAKKNKKPFAVVPCCIVGKHSSNVKHVNSWLHQLQNYYSKPCLQFDLPIRNRKTVLYSFCS